MREKQYRAREREMKERENEKQYRAREREEKSIIVGTFTPNLICVYAEENHA